MIAPCGVVKTQDVGDASIQLGLPLDAYDLHSALLRHIRRPKRQDVSSGGQFDLVPVLVHVPRHDFSDRTVVLESRRQTPDRHFGTQGYGRGWEVCLLAFDRNIWRFKGMRSLLLLAGGCLACHLLLRRLLTRHASKPLTILALDLFRPPPAQIGERECINLSFALLIVSALLHGQTLAYYHVHCWPTAVFDLTRAIQVFGCHRCGCRDQVVLFGRCGLAEIHQAHQERTPCRPDKQILNGIRFRKDAYIYL
mmetsp:Transcript_58779/g.158376  ORF Transcript_58779/g.158376 Transcript_58779/m.158376 type:complete len:252 (+) Transcript_58779:463-1218(+)